MKIGVLRERAFGERRVAIVPETVAKLAKLTGFIFDDKLLANDHFAKQGPGSLEASGIMRPEDIIV